MNAFLEVFDRVPEYRRIALAVEKTRLPLGVTGLSAVHKAHVAACLGQKFGRKILMLTPDEAQGEKLANDLAGFGCRALFYPARDYAFRSDELLSREYEHRRLLVLEKIASGEYDAVVASAEAAAQLTVPRETLLACGFALRCGADYPLPETLEKLVCAGYSRASQVEGPGQFSLRGGVLDVFPPACAAPVRMEFWGDTIDSMSAFDIESQRRTDTLDEVHISLAAELPAPDGAALAEKIETLASSLRGKHATAAKQNLLEDCDKLRSGARLLSCDRYLPLLYERVETLFDYTGSALLFAAESLALRESFAASESLFLESVRGCFEQGVLCKGLDRFMLTFPEILQLYEARGALYLDNFPRGSFDTPVQELVSISTRQLSPWNGSLAVLLEDIVPLMKNKQQACVVLAGTQKAARALCDDLEAENVRSLYLPELPANFPRGTVCVMQGSLSAGFDYPQADFMLCSYALRQQPAKKVRKGCKAQEAFHSLDELRRGDYIVHLAHGIGLFDGIVNLEAGGTQKDYIKIKYDKSDVLYVPVTQLDQISKYIGPQGNSEKPLKLNKLGGKEWQNTRARVRGAVKEMAKELTELYAKRLQVPGHAFAPDADMQNDFERRFEFEETGDQLRCIDEVKADMEKPHPMDRLLCGDVGFGKTEVALRAAFKCIADGKQCAILVPTTILALQHYQTLCRRFEGFPIESGMLSRFSDKKEMERIVKGLARGSVDIVVGTHRLISKDIKFRDLGLMIVDEEQRFGVAQKERLKELFPNVDVLTLTATPIPRTLNMAMSGIRDMSVLEEAPQNRSPVQTFVIEHHPQVIAQAIRTELRRGGQVYYLHNRVETIRRVAARLAEEVPEARIGIGHGKMSEEELSDIWRQLLEGEIDVLVCTTIIEAGIDVPNVNTLVIEDAERFGLSQLHQIRGRVGRSARRANAYFTFTRGKQLTEIAGHRLGAIREFTEFGSGFKIAMRDLELRGAGNILGAQQHGHMEAVGYEMYLRLLEQAVDEEKGIAPKKPERECVIDLPINAHIPESYIDSVPQRLGIYRRIADIAGEMDAADVLDELIDRFGEPPESVQGLITIALLRGRAMQHDIYEIKKQADRMVLYINSLDMPKISALAARFTSRVTVSAAGKPHIALKMGTKENALAVLEAVIDTLEKATQEEKQ